MGTLRDFDYSFERNRRFKALPSGGRQRVGNATWVFLYSFSRGAQPSEAVAQLLKITGDWQKFKGYKNTEGTLRVAEPKRDKLEIFNEALKDAASEPKAEAVTKRAAKKTAEEGREAG